jgi:hypothetical protein
VVFRAQIPCDLPGGYKHFAGTSTNLKTTTNTFTAARMSKLIYNYLFLLLFMSMEWDYISELRPLIPQMIYKSGEPR